MSLPVRFTDEVCFFILSVFLVVDFTHALEHPFHCDHQDAAHPRLGIIDKKSLYSLGECRGKAEGGKRKAETSGTRPVSLISRNNVSAAG